ncbi:TPA: AAA family ATPase [Streptococcus suis]
MVDNLANASENLYKAFGENEVQPDNLKKQDVDLGDLDKEHRQLIYFGAPGTGKSFRLNEDSEKFKSSNVERVTFHRSMTYGQFIGVFKPFPKGDSITYKYVPGFLMRQLIKAILNPSEAFLLIIEEINRADVSAVFGDFFQLLDRNSENVSVYPIAISYDFEYYIDNELEYDIKGISSDQIEDLKTTFSNGLFLPSNLFIWSTMNSADQGVVSMDTAFKRRWEQKYFGINDLYIENSVDFDKYSKIKNGVANTISWNDLRERINAKLIRLKVPEDKLLGPYFISKNVLESDETTVTESFESKVIMYIFDDVVRNNRRDFFNIEEERMIYSEIVKDFRDKGISVFNI